MKWRKMGRVYVPDGSMWWAKKYAFPPTPHFLNEEVIRMFVCFCDENMVGRVGYVDILADNPSEVVAVSAEPVLDIGTPGAFDENGLLPTCVLDVDGRLYMYYVGYQLGMKVRYYQFEGLAVSDDGGNSFRRHQRVPVTDRTDAEMLNRTSAFVRRRDGVFQMWYVGGSEWTVVNGKPLPMYNIKYMESEDGVRWPEEGRVCIDYESEDEHAFGKPFVIEDGGLHKMFYSVRTRSKGYRIGYAESADGHNWTRKDAEVGIDVSESGWDSQMIAYACVVRHKDKVYMFYNGNNLGETGFGYAVLEQW
jgi:predicted GH43/DUF377 family glycosyl hydrolase